MIRLRRKPITPRRYTVLSDRTEYCLDCERRVRVTIHGRCSRCDGAQTVEWARDTDALQREAERVAAETRELARLNLRRACRGLAPLAELPADSEVLQ